MKQIRYSVFETNSSSVHTLTVCTAQEYKDWAKGKLIYDYYSDRLIPSDDEVTNDSSRFLTKEAYEDLVQNNYEASYEEEYTSPSGDKIIIFGYYGRD